MLRLLLGTALYLAFTLSASAQTASPSAKQTGSIVTILSDGISEPNGLASQMLSQISVTLDKESDLRVLSVMGYGGTVNVRDLLQLRGADLAILNSDILAYVDLIHTLPDARRKIRLVAPLFSEGVFLFARNSLKSIDNLKGRKVGVLSARPSRGITAKTIFGLLKLNADIVEIDEKEFSKRVANDLDGILLFERDLKNLHSTGLSPESFHLVPIPQKGPLASIYLPKSVNKNALGNFAPAQDLQTVQVTTLLAAFDWSNKQSRFADVSKFVEKFFAVLPQLRASHPESPWSLTDVREALPGWEVYAPAQAPLAAALPPTAKAAGPKPLISMEDKGRPSEALKLSVIARPPLTNPREPDGGIILKLFSEALAASGMQISVAWSDGEAAQLDTLLNTKTADAALFLQSSDCEHPHALSATAATLCDRASLTEPVMQIVIGLFTRTDAALANGTDAAAEHVLCLPENQTLPATASASFPWLRAPALRLMRVKTLIDCVAAVERREADALIATEPEGRFVIEKLKLSDVLQMVDRPVATLGLHAAISRDNPRREELLLGVNRALASFKSSPRYSAVMTSHLAELTGGARKKTP